MVAIDHVTPAKALALGVALAAVNPKNLLMTVAAGVIIADGALDTGQQVVAVAVFIALAASTVVLAIVAYLVAKERMRRPLEDLRVWLQANNATVMAVLILVIGVTQVGKGLDGLLPPRCELAERGSLVIHAGQRATTAGSNRLWSVRLLYFAAVLSAHEGFGRQRVGACCHLVDLAGAPVR
jgi:hypothetical protein